MNHPGDSFGPFDLRVGGQKGSFHNPKKSRKDLLGLYSDWTSRMKGSRKFKAQKLHAEMTKRKGPKALF